MEEISNEASNTVKILNNHMVTPPLSCISRVRAMGRVMIATRLTTLTPLKYTINPMRTRTMTRKNIDQSTISKRFGILSAPLSCFLAIACFALLFIASPNDAQAQTAKPVITTPDYTSTKVVPFTITGTADGSTTSVQLYVYERRRVGPRRRWGFFKVGGTVTVTSGDWMISIPALRLPEGVFKSFSAIATDSEGSTSAQFMVSETVNIRRDTRVPGTPTITTQAQSVNDASFTISGISEHIHLKEVGATVELFVNTGSGVSSLGTATVTEKAWTKSITLDPGLNTFTVTVTDSAGNGPSVMSDAVGITLQTPPTVEITSTSGDNGDTVKAETLIYTATFGAGVNGFIADDIMISGSANGNAPTIVNFTGDDGDSTYTFEVAKGSSDGTVIVSIPENVAANSSGNSNTATVSPYILTIDTTPPGTPAITTTATTVNTESFTISGTADPGSIVLIGNGFTRASDSGTWEAEVTLTPGLNTLTATARDAIGNVSGASAHVIITLDTTAIGVFLLSNGAVNGGKALRFTVTLGKAVPGFDADNIRLTGTANEGRPEVSNFQPIGTFQPTGTGTGTAKFLTGNDQYTFEVRRGSSDGTVIVSVIAVAGRNDKFVPNEYIFTIDQPPSVVIKSVSGDSGDTVGTDTLAYTVQFNEAVSGFIGSDITISGTANGNHNPTIVNFVGGDGDTTYTFEAQKGSSDGTVIVSVPAGVADDNDGNSNTATVSPYILTIDTTAPGTPTIYTGGDYTASYTIDGNADAGSTVALSVDTGTGVVSLGSFPSNSNGYWVANVSLSYGTNTFTAVATDAVGNVSAETRAVIVRGRPAKPVINSGSQTVQSRGIDYSVFTLTGTAVSGLELDIQLFINGNRIRRIGTSTTVDGLGGWTIVFALGSGENRITVTTIDPRGNVSEESDAVTITLDVLPPLTATITSSSGSHNAAVSADVLNYTVMFSEAVGDFVATRDITIQGSANGGSPAITNTHIADNIAYSFDVEKGISDGDVLVHIQGVVVAGETINTPIYRLIIDTTRPGPSITSALGDSGDRVSTETLSYTVDFGEAVNGFAADKITISGSANGNDTPAIVNFVGSDGDRTYTFEVQRGSSDGTVIVAIPANVAMDDAGNSNIATVSPYTLTIDTVKPGKPEITVIADTIYVNNTASLTLSGTADVSSTAVELFEGDVSLGTTTATNGIWAIDITLTFLSEGSNLRLFTAIATDSADNQSEKSDVFNVDVVLDTEKPSPPKFGVDVVRDTETESLTIFVDKFKLRQDVNMEAFTLTGKAEEKATIQIWRSNNNSQNYNKFRDGISGSIYTLTGTATADVHGNWEFTVILSEGFNLYRASQQDRAGNVSLLSRVAFIDLDTIPPDEPHIHDGDTKTATVSAAKYTITGDGDVFGVDLYNGGVTSNFFIGTVASGNRGQGGARWDFDVTLHEGLNQIWVIERDRAGNRSEPAGPLNITLDRVPTVTIMSGTNPSNAAVKDDTLIYTVKFNEAVNGFAADDITISGTANGGSPTVTSFDGVDGGSTYTFEVEKGGSDGTVIVSIPADVAQDSNGSGNTASDIYKLTIDTISPAAPVITPSYTLVDSLEELGGFRIGGIHETGSIVDLSIDTGTGIVSLDAERINYVASGLGNDPWEIIVDIDLVGGTNTFTATATDVAGNVSVVSNVAVVFVSVVVPEPPSRPVIMTQDMRVKGSQSVTIRGTADADNLVKLFNISGSIISSRIIIGSGTATASGAWEINIDSGDLRQDGARRGGANTITATATDVNTDITSKKALSPVIITLDTTPPTAQIRSYSGHFGNRVDAEALIFAVIFTEPVTGFSGNTIMVEGSANGGNPAVRRFNTNDNQTYTFEVARGSSDGTVTVSINADVALDIVGNRGIGTDTYSLVIDTETQPPQVFITSRPPLFTNMPSFQIGGITANTGSIVELFRDVGTNAVPLGTASVTQDGQWTKTIDLIEGTNTIRVTAKDRTGRSEASDAFTITLDQTISHTVITMPLTSTSVNTPQLHISGTAEPNSSVQILSSGNIIAGGSATLVAGRNGFWTVFVPLNNGDNAITATATDVAGNTSTSNVVIITLDTASPNKPAITAPANTLTNTVFTLHGTAEPDTTVQLLSSGNIIAGATTTATNGDWTITFTLSEGFNTITATATDSAGNTSGVSNDVVTITLDSTPPEKPTIITPDATLVQTATLTLSGGASGASAVELFVDTGTDIVSQGTAPVTNNQWTKVITLTEGDNTITATATDAAGNTSTSNVVIITLDSDVPDKPTIIAPTATLVGTASLTLQGGAEAGSTIQLWSLSESSGVAITGATATATNDGVWTITFDLREGLNTIAAVAIDAAGNASVGSDVVTITRDTTKPIETRITVPADTLVKTATLTLSGVAEPDSTVQLSSSGSIIAGATAVATNGVWEITFDLLSAGDNIITATATDAAGNMSVISGAVTITLDTNAPAKPNIIVPDSLVTAVHRVYIENGAGELGTPIRVSVDGGITGGKRYYVAIISGDTFYYETKALAVAAARSGEQGVGKKSDALRMSLVDADAADNVTDQSTFGITEESGSTVLVNVNVVSLTLRGTADTDTAVELFRTGNSLGSATATNGAWTITFDLREGDNIITATATDAAGNTSVASDAVTITRDTVIPVVAITTAADTVNTAQFMVSGTADTGSTVQLSSSGDIIAGATAIAIDGAWTITFRLPRDGDNIIKVIATDGAGNVSTPSNAVTIRLDTDINKPHITPPAVTAVSNAVFTLSGTAEPDSTVQLSSSGTIINGAVTTATNGTWTITFDLGEGTNTITAIATDRAGNISTRSESVTITRDTTAPAKPMIMPDSLFVNVESLTLRGTAEMDSTVQLWSSGTIINGATAIATGGTWEIDVTLTTEVKMFTATAIDAAGNRSPESDAVTITRDIIVPPKPVIAAPADTLTNTALFTFEGTAEPRATIQLLSSRGPVTGATATVDVNGNWEMTTTTLFDGYSRSVISVEFNVTATDRAGNISTESNSVIIRLDTDAPKAPVILVPPADTSVTLSSSTLSGTADTGSTVQLLSSGVVIAGATAIPTGGTPTGGTWMITFELEEGDNIITATATDVAGNISVASDAVTITLDLVDRIVTESAHEILISFFRDVTSTAIPSDFSVSGVQSSPTVIAASKSGTANTILLTLSDNIVNGEDVTLSYTKRGDSIRVQNITLANFSNRVVINEVEVDRTSPSIEDGATNAAGSDIVLMFNEYMNVKNASTADFTVSVDSSGVPSKTIDVTTLTVERDKLTIGLMSNIVDGETVLLEYEARKGLPGITDVAGNALTGITDVAGNVLRVRREITNTAQGNDTPSGTLTIDGTLTVGMTLTANTDAISDGDGTGVFTYQWQSDGVDIENATGKTFTLTSEQIRKRIKVEARYTDGTDHVEILVSDQTDQGVKNIRPVVGITTMEGRFNESSFTISGTATAGSSVEISRVSGASVHAIVTPTTAIVVSYLGKVRLGTVTATVNETWSFPVMLAEGANIFIATATDQDDANNQSEVSGPVPITLDTIAPDKPVIAAPADTLTNTALLTLSGDAEAGSTVQLLSSGNIIVGATTTATTATNGTGTWTITFTLAEEGVNVITATATDAVSNKSEISEAVTIKLDRIAPAVTITTRPEAVNTASFTLAGTVEAGSTVEIFRGGVSIGAATVTGIAWTIDVTLDDGVNIFTAAATDSAGNTSAVTDVVIITLDTTAPNKPVITSSNTRVNMELFTINGTAEEDSTVEIFRGTVSFGTVIATSNTWTIDVTLDDGANVFMAKATDVAGNESEISEEVIITLDKVAPAVAIITTLQTVNTESFTLIGTAEAGSVVDVLKDGSSIGTLTATNAAWRIIVTLGQGANELTATATDVAGNKSEVSGPVTITLDSVAPTVTISSTSGGNGGTANTRTLSYTAIFSEVVRGFGDAGDFMVTGTANMGSPAVTRFSASADNRTYTFDVIATTDGSVTVSIAAESVLDIAGNGNTASNNYALTIDSTAPSVFISTRTPQSVNTESFTLTGTADAGSTVNLFRGAGTDPLGTVTATSGVWSIAVTLNNGANTFTATATDDNDKTGTSGEVIITLDSVAPSVDISSTSGDDGGTANTRTLSYTAIFDEAVSGFDEGDITVIGTANVGSPAVTSFSATDSRTYTFNVVATSDGSVTVSIDADVAQDIAGNGNAVSDDYTLTIDRAASTVSITTSTPQSVNTESFTLTGTADADSTVEVFQNGSSIDTTTATNGAWTITVTLAPGVNTFTATATDDAGNKGTSGAVIITLDSVAPSVVISSAYDGGTANTRTLSYTAIFSEGVSDFDEGDITVTDTVISGSGTVISGFDATDSRTYTFNAIAPADVNVTVSIAAGVAHDSAGNGNTASSAYTLTIDSMAPGVSITSTPRTVNTESFTLTGTADADSTVEVFQNGSSIDTTTATNGAWTITVTLTDGVNTFTATATDDADNTGTSGAVIITLDSVAPSVDISSTSGDDGGTANTRALSYTAIFSEGVNDFNLGDITVTDTSNLGTTATVISGFSATDSRTYTFNATAYADVNVTVSIAAGVAHDSAGNGNTASSAYTLTIDSMAPGVSITSTPQSVNTESFTLTGDADAGSLVDVLKDGRSIGTTTATTNGAWTIIVTLTEGVNTLTATATDSAGNTSDATDAVIITLDSVAPSVDISSTSGGNGGTANTRTLSYTAIFSEGVSDFDEGDITVTDTVISGSGTVISGFSATDSRTYTFNAIAPADVNVTVSIAAGVAHDSAGNGNTASSAYTLTIDRTAPTVSITTRTPQSVNTESFTLTGDADAGSLVDVLKDGRSIGTTTATTNGAWTITVTLTDGANTFRATATDDNDNTGTSGEVIITLDSVAPTVLISSASGDDGGTANTRTLSYTAIFSEGVSDFDEGDITVTDTVNSGSGTVISGFDATDSRTYTFNAISSADVNVTVSIAAGVAHDSAGNGNTASNNYALTIDSTAPTVSITTRTPQTVTTESFMLIGTADADSTVQLLRAGTVILGATATATGGTWTIIVTLTEGVNTFRATATDDNDNTGTSGAVIITLDSAAPAVAISTLAQAVNTALFTLTGTADAGSVVEVLQNGSSVGTETATGGTWTIIVTLDDGANTFTATATDSTGNTSDATEAVIITLDGTPETLMFISQYQKQITTNDNQTKTVTVEFGESKTVTVTIRAFTTTTSASADDVITKASNTLNIETAKDDFEFISYLPSVVKVDLLENAIVDIVITDAFGRPVPDACSVNSPCKVSLSYTDADLERLGVELPAELVVFHYTNNKWTELKSFVDPDSPNTIVGETASFSPFVLGVVTRVNTQFQRQVIARFTQALVANVARTVEGRVGTAFSDARQLASYQLDGQTVQLNGSDNLQDAMINKLPHYAKALKDGGMDWKAMLSRSSFVLPLNTAGNPDSEQSGMTLWGRGDYTKLSGKSDGLDWNGSLVGFQVGIDSRIRDDLLVGGLVSFGNGKTDSADHNLKNMTSVHPYMAWTSGDMSLWGSVGYGQGRAEVSAGNVTSKVSMLSLSGGVKGKLSQTGLSLKGDISLARTDVENAAKVNNQRLRLVLESERQRTLASGGTITPVLEAGLRYDSGDGESGLGAVLGAGIRHNINGWVVKGKMHAVVGQNNYQEWGIHGTIEKAPNVNERGLSFSLSPSYGATGNSASQIWKQNQSDGNNSKNSDDSTRLNVNVGYGLFTAGGLLTPYSELRMGENNRYRLGLRWKPNSPFNLHFYGERETGSDSVRTLLESHIRF